VTNSNNNNDNNFHKRTLTLQQKEEGEAGQMRSGQNNKLQQSNHRDQPSPRLSRYKIAASPSLLFEVPKTVIVANITPLRDGSFLSSCYNGSVKRFSPTAGEILNKFEVNSTKRPYCMAGLDDDTIVTGGHELKLWNISTNECLDTFSLDSFVTSLMCLRKKASTILVGLENSKEIMELRWRGYNLALVKTWEGHDSNVCSLCELSDGTIVSGSEDTHIKRWNANMGNCIGVFVGSSGAIRVLREMKDKRSIASNTGDICIDIWELSTCICRYKIKMNTPGLCYQMTGFVVMPDGALVSGHPNGFIQVWGDDGLKSYPPTPQTDPTRFNSFEVLEGGSLVIGGFMGYLEVRDTWMT